MFWIEIGVPLVILTITIIFLKRSYKKAKEKGPEAVEKWEKAFLIGLLIGK